MGHKLWLDTETFSATPINRGTDIYTRDAEVMLFAFALDDDPVRVYDCTEKDIDQFQMWKDIEGAINDPSYTLVAHNVPFDRSVLYYDPAWAVNVPLERWHCTMAQARAHALPGALGLLAEVLRVPIQKQENGRALIQLFCKPRPKNMKIRRATRHTHPDEWAQFVAYAADDVEAMRGCYKAMPKRNYEGDEKRLWCVDQRINERGFCADMELVDAAIDALKDNKQELDERVEAITSGVVKAATQRDKLLAYLLEEHGVILESLSKKNIEDMLEEDWLPDHARELLKLRIESAMASTSKYTRLKNCVSEDNRMRHTLVFAGASRTARWAGRTYQPQNLPRPTMANADIEACIGLLKSGHADAVDLFGDNLRSVCSNALRGIMVAPPGKKLVVCDWSNIEGRVAAWLSGEKWKLDAFAALDAGRGKDLYVLSVARAYNKKPDDITKYERQQGKGMELSLGYGGGVMAFMNVALSYGLDLDELGRKAPDLIPYEALAQARAIWQWAVKKDKTFGFEEHVYVACEAIKAQWRKANAHIVQAWDDLETAAKCAITYPGQEYRAARCVFVCRNSWLMVRLPSGRHLMYPSPRILSDNSISYSGPVNKTWRRIKTYGGKLLENVTQAASRDILAASLLTLDARTDCEVVMHVHDEVVAEAPENGGFDLAELERIMITNPGWAEGLPLAAAGFEARRYEKH